MINLLQISDSHIGARSDYALAGVDTWQSFNTVLEEALQSHPADAVLFTGDLSADYSEGSYARFVSAVSHLTQPYYWLPGNHDKISNMAKAAPDWPFVQTFDIGNWSFVMLDSAIPQSPNGRLGESQLDVLEQSINNAKQPNVIIFMHHHPIDVGCAWLDSQRLADSQAFFRIIDRSPNVRGIFWGHVHQEFNAERNGVVLGAVPSTCIQFLPNSDDFALDTQMPGYRSFTLHDDGRIESHVHRVEVSGLSVDVNCIGYD